MSEKYVTVLQLAREAKDWPLVSLLYGEEMKDWPIPLRNIFERARENRDDKSALQYFKLWMWSIGDSLLASFTQPVKDGYILEGDLKEIFDAKAKAAFGRANWAQQAWNALLASDAPLLPETREAILTEIANRWRTTPDEKEADQWFDFLTGTLAMPKGEYKTLVSVFRKTTDVGFPPERLGRHFLSYYGRQKRMSEISNILAMGRARNAVDPGNEIALVRHLENCSDPAFRFAEKFVEQIGTLDRAVLALRYAVQSERERRGDREEDGVLQGIIEFDYKDLDAVHLSIQQRHHKARAEDLGHSQFELARVRVESWKKKNPNVGVLLTLTVRGVFPEDTLFVREQKL